MSAQAVAPILLEQVFLVHADLIAILEREALVQIWNIDALEAGFLSQTIGQGIQRRVFAVNEKCAHRFLLDRARPSEQSVAVRVAGEAGDRFDLRVKMVRPAENLDYRVLFLDVS